MCLYILTLFLDKGRSSLVWLLPLLASLKVICSCSVPVSFFFWTSPSLTHLPSIFGAKTQEFEVPSRSPQPALRSVEDCQAHFPTRAFKTSSKGRPVPSWAVQVLCKGVIGFPHNPRNIGLSLFLSLPLFSTLSFPQDRPTPGQRPFAILDHATCNTPLKLAPRLR